MQSGGEKFVELPGFLGVEFQARWTGNVEMGNFMNASCPHTDPGKVAIYFTGKKDGPKMDLLIYLPANAKGVQIADIVIPAKQDEAKLVLVSPAGSMPGNVQNILVKATALYGAGKVPIVHESKIGVNVVK